MAISRSDIAPAPVQEQHFSVADIFSEKPVLTARELVDMGCGFLLKQSHLYGLDFVHFSNGGRTNSGLKNLFGNNLRAQRYYFLDMDEAIDYFANAIVGEVDANRARALRSAFVRAGFDNDEAMLIVSKKYTYSASHLMRLDTRRRLEAEREREKLKEIGIRR